MRILSGDLLLFGDTDLRRTALRGLHPELAQRAAKVATGKASPTSVKARELPLAYAMMNKWQAVQVSHDDTRNAAYWALKQTWPEVAARRLWDGQQLERYKRCGKSVWEAGGTLTEKVAYLETKIEVNEINRRDLLWVHNLFCDEISKMHLDDNQCRAVGDLLTWYLTGDMTSNPSGVVLEGALTSGHWCRIAEKMDIVVTEPILQMLLGSSLDVDNIFEFFDNVESSLNLESAFAGPVRHHTPNKVSNHMAVLWCLLGERAVEHFANLGSQTDASDIAKLLGRVGGGPVGAAIKERVLRGNLGTIDNPALAVEFLAALGNAPQAVSLLDGAARVAWLEDASFEEMVEFAKVAHPSDMLNGLDCCSDNTRKVVIEVAFEHAPRLGVFLFSRSKNRQVAELVASNLACHYGSDPGVWRLFGELCESFEGTINQIFTMITASRA